MREKLPATRTSLWSQDQAAETGNKGHIENATKQMELALFTENRLDFHRKQR
jgi:hypothetical protein